jgi:hypothetical protein
MHITTVFIYMGFQVGRLAVRNPLAFNFLRRCRTYFGRQTSRVLFTNSAETRREDRQIFPDRRDSISFVGYILCNINMAITAIDNLGVNFRCGIVAGIVFGLVVALATGYAIYLYVTVTASLRTALVERQWGKVFGPRSVAIVSIVSLCTVVFRISVRLRSAERRLLFLIAQFAGPERPAFLSNHYILAVMILIVFMIPTSAVQSLRPYVAIAALGVVAALVSLVHTGYWFGRRCQEVGFDKGERIHLFKTDSILYFIAESITDYQLVPIAWPGSHHLKLSTPSRLMLGYAIALGALYIFTTARGFFAYCSFYGANMTDYLRNAFGDRWYVRGAEIAEILIGVTSIAGAVNPARFVMLNAIEEAADIPIGIWGFTGFAISMIAMVFIELGDVALTVLKIIHIVGCALLTFILPEIVFISVLGKTRTGHFFGAILMIVVGVSFIVIALYDALAG